MYSNYAGGVAAINRRNFYAVNGFSNDYWGWGSEDEDFSARLELLLYNIAMEDSACACCKPKYSCIDVVLL